MLGCCAVQFDDHTKELHTDCILPSVCQWISKGITTHSKHISHQGDDDIYLSVLYFGIIIATVSSTTTGNYGSQCHMLSLTKIFLP
jgi:hypothetical protein